MGNVISRHKNLLDDFGAISNPKRKTTPKVLYRHSISKKAGNKPNGSGLSIYHLLPFLYLGTDCCC